MCAMSTLPVAAQQSAGTSGSDLCLLPYTAIRERLMKDLSPVDLVDALINRHELVNGKLNACVQVNFARAREQAKIWENDLQRLKTRRADGKHLPTLFGLLFGVKDMFDVKGLPTSSGSPMYLERTASNDSEIVMRFQKHGAFPAVKTNMPFRGFSWTDTANAPFGTTNNPRDFSRVPGGSSGGSAAAVASGLSWIDIGADAGGSIRIPSALCGVYGLRPRAKFNRRLLNGLHPPFEGHPGAYFLTAGPIARSVSDLELVLPIFLNGSDHERDSTIDEPRDLKIAFFTEWGDGFATPIPEIQSTIRKAAQFLEDSDYVVSEQHPEFLRGSNTADIALSSVFATGLADSHRKLLQEHGILNSDPIMSDINDLFTKYPSQRLGGVDGMQKHLDRLNEWRNEMNQFMRGIDALIMPIAANVPPKHGATFADPELVDGFGTYALAASIMDNLAAGGMAYSYTDIGLPLGLQVIAKTERTVLRVMKQLELGAGGFQPPVFA
jgi:amidase